MKITRVIYIVAIIFSFQFSIEVGFAQSDLFEVHQINGKNYYIHLVEQGNTLYSIHLQYNVPIEVIQQENPSVNDGLSIGEKILIPVKKNTEAEFQPIDGNYFLHKVEKGRTLYSLAKEFNLQQKDITALNPGIDETGIQEGQLLKIPIKEPKQSVPIPNQSLPETHYLTHVVKAGETLYSLSKLYQVSVDSIKLVNKGLLDGLKVDQTINIPRKKMLNVLTNQQSQLIKNSVEMVKNSVSTIPVNEKKATYKIALLLPFYIEENQEIPVSQLEMKKIYPKSTFAVEFYQGFLLALDSISTKETRFEVYAYDSKGQDSIKMIHILAKPELEKMDLIIGPLYASNFERVAKFAAKHNIAIVSPVKQTNKILLSNNQVFKAVPSRISAVNQIVKLVIDSFSRDYLVAFQYQNNAESALVDSYIKEYNTKVLQKNDTSRYSSIKKVVISKSDDVISQLKLNGNNVFFIPTVNSMFITNLFISLNSKLLAKDYKNCKITLIGLEEWLQFDNIDIEYFQTLNVHVPINQFVDYEDEHTKIVVKKYIKQNETFPTNNAFLGFDLASYFGKNLIKYGSVYSDEGENNKQISTQFNFFKTGVESGYENLFTHIVKFDNYSLRLVY